MPEAGIAFQPRGVRVSTANILSLVKALKLISHSTKEAKRRFAGIEPSAVVGFGGYVSIPGARAAEQMGIPGGRPRAELRDGPCEQGTFQEGTCGVPDLRVREARALPFRLPLRCIVTGNPVRKKVLLATREEGRRMPGISTMRPCLPALRRKFGRAPAQRGYRGKSELLAEKTCMSCISRALRRGA